MLTLSGDPLRLAASQIAALVPTSKKMRNRKPPPAIRLPRLRFRRRPNQPLLPVAISVMPAG